MQRPSTASIRSTTNLNTTYVLRSIVLPYLFPSPAQITSTNQLRPVSKATVTDTTAPTISATTFRQCPSKYSTGSSSSSFVDHQYPASASARRSIHTTARRTTSSFQKIKGHDPPTTASKSEPIALTQTSAQRRTRDYLQLRSEPRAPNDDRQGGGAHKSSRTKTMALALDRILQAYDPKTMTQTDENEGDEIQNDGKGKGKTKLAECDNDDGVPSLHSATTTHTTPTTNAHAVDATKSPLTASPSSSSMLGSPPPTTIGGLIESGPSSDQLHPQDQVTASSSKLLSFSSLQSLKSMTSTTHTAYPFPPIISRLLASRYFRLAVFHILQTPAYAVDEALISAVVEYLEARNAGKLAFRLRRGYEMSTSRPNRTVDDDNRQGGRDDHAKLSLLEGQSGSSTSDSAEVKNGPKPRLWSDPVSKGGKKRLPADYWRVSDLPPIKPDYQPPLNPKSTHPLSLPDLQSPSHSQPLTEYHNAHLLWLLRRPNSLFSSSLLPVTDFSPQSRGSKRWPAPAPNLLQLRKLLQAIRHLEQHHDFKPNQETANIVLRCWLRSAAPSPSPSSAKSLSGRTHTHALDYRYGKNGNGEANAVDNFRLYVNNEGETKMAYKVESENGLNAIELRGLFELISRIIVKNNQIRASPSPRSTSGDHAKPYFPPTVSGRSDPSSTSDPVATLDPHSHGPDKMNTQLGEKQYRDNVRPFGSIMIRAMKGVNDKRGEKKVIGWMKEQRKLLLGDDEGVVGHDNPELESGLDSEPRMAGQKDRR